MAYRKRMKPEGGSGGRRGHSNMAHWAKTAEVKHDARLARRRMDRAEVAAQRP